MKLISSLVPASALLALAVGCADVGGNPLPGGGGEPTNPAAACDDGVQNGFEQGVDCGGGCPFDCPPTCHDGVENGDEEGVDCGVGACGVACGSIEFLDVLCENCELSADGSTLVGSIPAKPRRAVRWTREQGAVELGDLPGGNSGSRAYAVSADGSVVVGRSHSGSPQAFRWSEAEGMIGLPGAGATDVSADGRIVLLGDKLWSEAGGVTDLDGLQGAAISGDGTVVFGNGYGSPPGEHGAQRWTEAEGTTYLGPFSAAAASADGSTVVGVAHAINGVAQGYYRWVEGEGLSKIPLIPIGVSDDGRTVYGWTAFGGLDRAPALWTEDEEVIVLGGIDFNGYARGMSSDAKTVLIEDYASSVFIWHAAN